MAIECDTDGIDAGDELDLDIKSGILKNLTKGTITAIEPLPDVMIKLLEKGTGDPEGSLNFLMTF